MFSRHCPAHPGALGQAHRCPRSCSVRGLYKSTKLRGHVLSNWKHTNYKAQFPLSRALNTGRILGALADEPCAHGMGFLSLGTSLHLDVGSTSLVAQCNAVNRVLSGTRGIGAVLSWLEVNLDAGRGLDLHSLSQGRVQGQGLGCQMGSILALPVRRAVLLFFLL